MNDFQKQFNRAISQYAQQNQYGVSLIPVHHHDGTDAPNIPITSIENSTLYVAVATITLTSAQIKALNTTPITLIPKIGNNSTNVGINYVYIIEGITARLYYGGTAYTGANNLEFRYTDAAGAKVTADLPNTFINSTANTFAHVAGITTAFTPVYNAPIVVTVPVANPATGNSNITFVIKYRVVSI